MHYIRLLRPVGVEAWNEDWTYLKVLMTITTDLGDSFYAPSQPLALNFAVDHAEGRIRVREELGQPIFWKAGIRHLTLKLAVHVVDLFQEPVTWPVTLRIFAASQPVQPHEKFMEVQTNPALPFWRHGLKDPPFELIIPCHIELRLLERKSPFRSLLLPCGRDLTFKEELGESIARHLWDAGLVTASFISDMAADKEAISSVWPIASDKVNINVLELGCGIGVLGITVAAVLEEVAITQGCKDPAVDVLITDVEGAEKYASANINAALERLRSAEEAPPLKVAYETLDWNDGRQGKFGPLASRRWDYVILSDCTYNVDSFPALVETLSAVHAQNCSLAQSEVETRVILATKPRHSSEEELFSILDREGWQYRITKSIPITRDNAEDEVVHIYMLEKGTTPTAAPASSSSSPSKKRKTPDRTTEGSTAVSEPGTVTSPTKKART